MSSTTATVITTSTNNNENSDYYVYSSLGNITNDTFSYINKLIYNPTVITIIAVIIFAYVCLFIVLGNNSSSSANTNTSVNTNMFSNTSSTNTPSKTQMSSSIVIVLTIIFLILVVINGLQYFLGYNISASISHIFENPSVIDIDVVREEPILPPPPKPTDIVPEIKIFPQVFNIPQNDLVYPDAKALCKAYGARLATYKEIEDAYNDGAEWCNYGWSDGQMALYPTQLKTWKKLQDTEGHENDCGRPGINGGFIDNPAVKFGANCYGYKPKMTDQERELMNTQPIYPTSAKDMAIERRVGYWQDKLPELLVSPFNSKKWSKI